MSWAIGQPASLYITQTRTNRIGYAVSWDGIAGLRVKAILDYDPNDDSYYVALDGLPQDVWIPGDWIVEGKDNDGVRHAWRCEQLSEAQRQMEYAAAFQRLLWREMGGRALRKAVGSLATVKGVARTMQTAFPDAWMEDHYVACWGRTGKVIGAIREMGADGELHNLYHIAMNLPESTGLIDMQIYFTGEDLES